jgi:predicted amidophosphoribosyltransferase
MATKTYLYHEINNCNMSGFRCHKCGFDSSKTGSCPKCNIALERVCGVCGEEEDLCTCQSARVQTKGGPGPGKSHSGVQTKQ